METNDTYTAKIHAKSWEIIPKMIQPIADVPTGLVAVFLIETWFDADSNILAGVFQLTSCT